MSIVNRNNTNTPSSEGVNNTKNKADVTLHNQEIEYLLMLIKESTFKGEHVEIVYNIAYKLQQQYLNQK